MFTTLSAYLGRFHLLALHLPIGIIVLAAILVLLGKWQKQVSFRPIIAFSIKIAAVFAVLTALLGWLLAGQGGYDSTALWWHQWTGFAAAAFSMVCWWQIGKPYFDWAVLGAAACISAAGHFGGNLTHGPEYLFAAPETVLAIDPEAPAYDALIQPILNRKCVSCHNPSKAKGDLMLDTYEHLLKGGEKGVEIMVGSADSSALYQRLVLPAHEEEHMPPKGKPQLTPEEIEIVAKWLNAGGNRMIKAAAIMPQNAVSEFPKVPVDSPKEEDLTALRTQLIPVMSLGNDLPWVSVSLKGKKEIPPQLYQMLTPIADQMVHLDASHSGFSDALLAKIGQFKHLTRLNLANTRITAAGLGALAGLVHLRYLNLTENNVDDSVLEVLQQLPALREIGLMGTAISAAGVQQLQQHCPGIRITQAAPLDSTAQSLRLYPPKLVFAHSVFDDTVHVDLDFGFKSIGLFYTLDQSSPTSQSLRYSGTPIVLEQSGTVRAIAIKEGWNDSEIVEQTFAKRKYRPTNAVLSSAPSPKYPGNGAASLFDNKLGTDRAEKIFLGYEGEHLTATFDFGKAIDLNKITLHYLEDNNAWIFAPAGMKVWCSTDGKKWTSVVSARYAVTNSLQPLRATVRTENLSKPTLAQWVKITVESQQKCPAWHVGAGNKCWIFVDEVLFE